MPKTPNARPGDDLIIRVRDLTEAQMAHIDDIVGSDWQHGEIIEHGKSFLVASAATLDALIEDLDFKLGDDHHMNVAGGSLKDLSDHQVNMIVANIEKCLKGAIKKINQAIHKAAADKIELEGTLTAAGTGIAAAIKEAIAEPTPLPELDVFFKPERLPAEPTPAKHRERMVRYEVLKTFDLAFFATEDHASEFAAFVRKQGDKYRLKGLEHMNCDREKHLDRPEHNLYAVSCKGR